MTTTSDKKRARFGRTLDQTGEPDVAIAKKLGFDSSILTRLRHSTQQPSLFKACLLVSAFGGRVAFEDFLTPEQARKVKAVAGTFAGPFG